jgi:DNA-binding response OmpR family regulator
MMGRILAQEGFRCVLAASAEEGLELARVVDPAVILLDVLMPEKNGWETLRALKSDPDLVSCPVVMLTMVDDKKLGFALGAADYLMKPVDRNEMARVLARFRGGEAGRRALVVEDDAATRILLARTLQRDGWTVEQAADGESALAALHAVPPDLIVLDLMLPVADGFSLLERLRAEPRWAEVPVVVATGKALTADERGRLEHARAVLRKSEFRPADLLGEVRKLMAAPAHSASARELVDA